MQLKSYIFKAVSHNGQDVSPMCGKMDCYEAVDVENFVIDQLQKMGSNDLTDYVIRLETEMSADCPLMQNRCNNCGLKL
jgi:hypothetical protein